jgi:hypothetical protein
MVLVEEERLHPESSLPKFGENRKPLSVKCGPRPSMRATGLRRLLFVAKTTSALTRSKIRAE